MPTTELANALLKVPLVAQFLGVPFYCCTEKLGSLLGTALGPAEEATIHRSVSSGGLFIRCKVSLDVNPPLPDEVSTFHEDPSKGCFKVKVKFESLPQFCFLCGVIGHMNRFCPKKDELAVQPPRYGKHLVASEFGPRVREDTLARRRKRFVWTLAGNSAGARLARNARNISSVPGRATAIARQEISPQQGVATHLRQLYKSSIAGSPTETPQQAGDKMLEHGEPKAIRVRLGPQEQVVVADQDNRVEAAGPNRPQADP
ncbi:unnamed protein product [Linum trigynum]|uniref:CCHC-type domain-containing protein n=1 Tax=Linum trigynum TaxID=586398 RepID=A0AAV2FEC4_9ROSI